MLVEAFPADFTPVYLLACLPMLMGLGVTCGDSTAPLKVSFSSQSHAAQACVHRQAPGAASPPLLGLVPSHQRDQLPPLALPVDSV